MSERWKTAALGGVMGAALSLVVMFAAVAFGFVPAATNARIHAYMMANPKLVGEMQDLAELQAAEAERRAQQDAVDRLGPARFFDPAVAYVTGPATAKNTFVEFFDYNCGHCRNNYPTVQKFYEKHKGDTRFAFIDFPIFGEMSTAAARAAIAARSQGDRYLALHFAMMGEGSTAINVGLMSTDAVKAGLDTHKLAADMNAPSTDKVLVAVERLARDAHFQGTPVFIINGQVHEGEITEAELKKLLKS